MDNWRWQSFLGVNCQLSILNLNHINLINKGNKDYGSYNG